MNASINAPYHPLDIAQHKYSSAELFIPGGRELIFHMNPKND